MAEVTNDAKFGLEDVGSAKAADFHPRNVCPICFTRGGAPEDNALHLEWHEKSAKS